MAKFLSEEFFAEELAALKSLDEMPGVAIDLQIKVTDGPDGDTTCFQQVVDGQLVAAGLGKSPGKMTTEVKAKWADAVAIARGQADPHVFYMQGRTKLSGDMHALLIHLRPVTTSEAFAAAWAKLMEATTTD